MSDLEDLTVDKEPATPAAATSTALPSSSPPAEKKSALDRMVSGIETEPPKALIEQLGGIKRQEISETQRVTDRSLDRLHKDQAQMEKAYSAAGVGPGTLPPPWDADGQREKYSTDPIAAFGSVASIFAIAAAAFTHAPMENALNGAASAMNAIHAGDEKAYEKAHQAWKDNTDLAVKRHNMMQQDYDNAIKKLNVNAIAGKVEMQAVAQKYGDQAMLALLEGGYDERIQNLQDSRNKSKLEIVKAAVHMEQQHDALEQRKEAVRLQHEDRKAQLEQRAHESSEREKDRAERTGILAKQQVERERTDREKEDIAKKRLAETERKNKVTEAYKSGDMKTIQADIVRGLASDDPAEAEKAQKKYEAFQKVQSLTGAKGGVLTMARNDAAEVVRRQNEYIDQGMDPGPAFDKARSEVAAKAKAPSAVDARREETTRKFSTTLDEAIKLVEDQVSGRGKSVTGFKGEANRWKELGSSVAPSIFGKDKTEAHDFAQKSRIMEALLPQVLGARANIAKDERDKAQQIVGGLSRFTPSEAALNDLKFLKRLTDKAAGKETKDTVSKEIPSKTEREDGKTYQTKEGAMVWSASDSLWYTPEEWKAKKK